MIFEQLYKTTLAETYKDELLAWLKNQQSTNYYLLLWKDKPIRVVVDRNDYYKYYSSLDNTKKVIATVTPDKTYFISTNIINLFKQCLSKLNAKIFESNYNKFISEHENYSRKEYLAFIVDTLSSLDSRILTKVINLITEKTYENYLQSKAYQQHLLRLNHYEQEKRTRELTNALINAKSQVQYYKTKSIKAASKELTAIKKLLEKTPRMNLIKYLDKRLTLLNKCEKTVI